MEFLSKQLALSRNHFIIQGTEQWGPGYPPQGVGSPDP